jgi:hypothetical protein
MTALKGGFKLHMPNDVTALKHNIVPRTINFGLQDIDACGVTYPTPAQKPPDKEVLNELLAISGATVVAFVYVWHGA